MSLTAQSVITRIGVLLQDTTHVRWPEAELLLYISDARREIVGYKPDAFVRTRAVELEPGTRQTLPDDAVMLVDVVRNAGESHHVPRVVTREILDAQMPNWHDAPRSPVVKHYCFDPQNQRAFYVFPPQPLDEPGWLELVFAVDPPELTDPDEPLELDMTWLPVITNYTAFRCYSKDAEHAANAQIALAFHSAFTQQIGARTAGEVSVDVNAPTPA